MCNLGKTISNTIQYVRWSKEEFKKEKEEIKPKMYESLPTLKMCNLDFCNG